MNDECPRCKELIQSADEVLNKLVNLTQNQLEAFQERNMRRFTVLDKELELTVGKKERTIGALREHRREHGDEQIPKAS